MSNPEQSRPLFAPSVGGSTTSDKQPDAMSRGAAGHARRDAEAASAVDELRETSQRLQAALEAVEVTVFDQDMDLRYTWIHNPALGFAAEAVLGKRDVDLFPRPADAELTESIKRAVIASGTAQRREVAIYFDGMVRWYDLAVQPKRDAVGHIVGVTCAAVDITPRRHREAHAEFVARLDEALEAPASASEIARITAARVAEHLDLQHCLLVDIDEAANVAHVFHDHAARDAPGGANLVGRYAIDDFHTPDERTLMTSGRVMVVDDVAAAPRAQGAADRFHALGVASLVNAPHGTDGRWRFVLSAMRAQPCRWSQGEVRLLRELATRTFLRIERARADEQLRATRNTFEHLVQHSPFGIYAVDADFRLVLVSAGAQKVFENVRPLIGRDFAEVLRLLWPEPFASEAIGHFRRVLETGEPYHAPSTVERRQDTDEVEAYDWKIERVTLPDGRPGVVCHFYDLSERQRYEQALRSAERQRTDFLAMLAHELRNPLAPITSAVALMKRPEADLPLLVRCRDIVERQVGQVTRLLEDVIDLARLERSSFALQRSVVRLSQVLEAARESSQPLLEQRGLQLELLNDFPELLLHADAARLTQVFVNLLNNAARYGVQPGPSGARSRGAVVVRVEPAAGWVSVRVRDHGVGMSEAVLARVFDLYARGEDAHLHSPAGLGLGLTLARHLVELHGGQISAHSEGEGRGSEFVVRLPLAQAVVDGGTSGGGEASGAAGA